MAEIIIDRSKSTRKANEVEFVKRVQELGLHIKESEIGNYCISIRKREPGKVLWFPVFNYTYLMFIGWNGKITSYVPVDDTIKQIATWHNELLGYNKDRIVISEE